MPKQKRPSTQRPAAGRRRTSPPTDALAQVRALLLGPAIVAQQQQRRKLERHVREKTGRSSTLATRTAKLSKRLTRSSRSTDRTVKELQRSLQQARQETQREIATAAQQLRAEMATMLGQLEQRFTAALSKIEQGKTDSKALASLFEDFALRVSGSKQKHG